MNKNVRYVVSDLVKAGLLWLWLAKGSAGAGHVFALYTWFMFLMCLVLLSRQVRANARRKWWLSDRGDRHAALRNRLDIAFDILVIAVLAWFGHMVLAVLALSSLVLVSIAVFGGSEEDRADPDTGFAHDEPAA